MIYDEARRRVVVFSGRGAGGNDTWEWDGSGWLDVTTPGSPPARSRHAMAYDVARRRAVMFGGDGGVDTSLADTWERPYDPADRPGALVHLDLGGAAIRREEVRAIQMRSRAGGRALAAGGASQVRDGAELLGWDVSKGRWSVLGTNAAPPPAPGQLDYESVTRADAQRLLLGVEPRAHFLFRPLGGDVDPDDPAVAAVDYVEVTVTYRIGDRPACGNGQVERAGGERCDDANAPTAGCSQRCTVEPGWTCAGEPSLCAPCGDGIQQVGQACDDQNVSNGDGCNSACRVEVGWDCSGAPSTCAPSP